ncbi:hypothetical protein [Heliorestis convoluta]|nr:hypothetical protein [Heliorestis convoluta]
MKKIMSFLFLPLLLLMLLFVTACGSSQDSTGQTELPQFDVASVEQAFSSRSSSASPSEEMDGDINQALQDEEDSRDKSLQQQKDQIVGDYIFALSLEQQLHGLAGKWKSQEEVYQFYRQGFSDTLALNLTDYSWSDSMGLISTEPSMFLPDSDVHILEVDLDHNIASVWHLTSSSEQHVWGTSDYTVATLHYEKGQWKIYDTDHRNQLPKR